MSFFFGLRPDFAAPLVPVSAAARDAPFAADLLAAVFRAVTVFGFTGCPAEAALVVALRRVAGTP